MAYKEISLVKNYLLEELDWSHSFIREFYFVNNHQMREYTDDQHRRIIGDRGGSEHAKLLVLNLGREEVLGVEFFPKDLLCFALYKTEELQFRYERRHEDSHLLHLGDPDSSSWFEARSIGVKTLGREYLGANLHLGYEFPIEEHCVAAESLENCWRLCGQCSNAWQESPTVEYSRCPKCEVLTRISN